MHVNEKMNIRMISSPIIPYDLIIMADSSFRSEPTARYHHFPRECVDVEAMMGNLSNEHLDDFFVINPTIYTSCPAPVFDQNLHTTSRFHHFFSSLLQCRINDGKCEYACI